jgi:hypothetical protein
MVIPTLGKHRNHDSFGPCPVDELFDFMLTAPEGMLMSFLCQDRKAIEVAETIVNDLGDLARVFHSFGMRAPAAGRFSCRPGHSELGRRHGRRIAPHPLHPGRHDGNVPLDHRIPAVGPTRMPSGKSTVNSPAKFWPAPLTIGT